MQTPLAQQLALTSSSVCINKAKFSIFHLNVNSIFNKLIDLHSIISKHDFDFISLNETWLDSTVPDSFYANDSYNIHRRDRGFGRGGGVIVLIRKSYKILDTHISDSFELIYVVIDVSNTPLHFICCYKSPSTDDTEFLEHLEALVLSINLNESIFIIGDLNMDLLSIHGKLLKEFISRFSFSNLSSEPTRTASRIHKATNSTSISSTLLDVVLHNNSFISQSIVIPCSFSDHSMLISNLTLPSEKFVSIQKSVRKLDESNLRKIAEISTPFQLLPNVSTNDNWLILKTFLLACLNQIAPKRSIIFKTKSTLLWDNCLLKQLRNTRDKLYKQATITKLATDWSLYADARSNYQKQYR